MISFQSSANISRKWNIESKDRIQDSAQTVHVGARWRIKNDEDASGTRARYRFPINDFHARSDGIISGALALARERERVMHRARLSLSFPAIIAKLRGSPARGCGRANESLAAAAFVRDNGVTVCTWGYTSAGHACPATHQVHACMLASQRGCTKCLER